MAVFLVSCRSTYAALLGRYVSSFITIWYVSENVDRMMSHLDTCGAFTSVPVPCVLKGRHILWAFQLSPHPPQPSPWSACCPPCDAQMEPSAGVVSLSQWIFSSIIKATAIHSPLFGDASPPPGRGDPSRTCAQLRAPDFVAPAAAFSGTLSSLCTFGSGTQMHVLMHYTSSTPWWAYNGRKEAHVSSTCPVVLETKAHMVNFFCLSTWDFSKTDIVSLPWEQDSHLTDSLVRWRQKKKILMCVWDRQTDRQTD